MSNAVKNFDILAS